jgi:hypothetical protein
MVNKQQIIALILEALNEEDFRDKYGHLIATDIPKLKKDRYQISDREIVFILQPLISFVNQEYAKIANEVLREMIEDIVNIRKLNPDMEKAVAIFNKKYDAAFSVKQIKNISFVFKVAEELRGVHNLINFYQQVTKREGMKPSSYQPSKDTPREATPVLKEKKVKVKYKCN